MHARTDLRLGDGDHVVQFYDDEAELVGVVAGYLSGALLDGDAVVVIATPRHREALHTALSADVEATAGLDEARLVVLDAAEILALVMVDGMPDVAMFDGVVGAAVRSAAGGRQVRAYGEMVALLWEAGNIAAAIELERLWNELAERTRFALFCSYPAHLIADRDVAEAFAEVCHLHSRVVAGAPTPEGPDAECRLAGTPQASGLARRFVTDTLLGWNRPELVDDALLVVAELVSNAVLHARSDVTVGLSRREGRVRLEVGDSSIDPPRLRDVGSATTTGRGLHLIGAIAERWGHSLVDGGKLVWVDLLVDDTAPVERMA